MAEYEKPLPNPNADTKPFWDYCRKHELRLQKCTHCGYVRLPPSVICPKCHSMEAEWVKLRGRGKVFTFTVFHHIYNKSFTNDIPYVVASIELEEGPRIMSNITGCRLKDINIGMPVEVCFEDITDEFTLPKFVPRVTV